ncbi:hypothetical protein cyc_03999 [Cyclospora cayetanensis]|nr:hypothetical protein cyc_03999 [Cyclospora cayetanensis]
MPPSTVRHTAALVRNRGDNEIGISVNALPQQQQWHHRVKLLAAARQLQHEKGRERSLLRSCVAMQVLTATVAALLLAVPTSL